MAPLAEIAFLDGNFWLGVFVGILLVGLIVGAYTRRGSGISTHPTSERRGQRAPGAAGVPHGPDTDDGGAQPTERRARA